MNFQNKNLILYSIVLISLGISVFLWDKIFLPFKDPKIIGVYTQQEYHSLPLCCPAVSFNGIGRHL